MIAAVVFSRDRAMQLDLLLRSLDLNAPGIFGPVYVLYRATDAEHERAYRTCQDEHPAVYFLADGPSSFRLAARLLHPADWACFFTDDSVLYRPLPRLGPAPFEALDEGVLCFSLRLGRNTTWCYPHARPQRLPEFRRDGSLLSWEWQGADGDFGYPASVDGHVFRGASLRAALQDCPAEANPNRVEDHLVRAFSNDRGRMACYYRSHLLGIPANRVNETHPNRYGDRYPVSTGDLLARYLLGERIALERLDFSDVRGAHQEIELVFE